MMFDSRELGDGVHGGRAGAVWRPPPGKRGACLLASLVARPGSCIRRLARGDRARQMQFTRFLHNKAVSVSEMAAHAAARTADRVAGRDILAIQDSSELVFGGKKARQRGFGPIGRGGALGGLLLHAGVAVEAGSGALLGLFAMRLYNRAGSQPEHRRKRATPEKESQRWIDGMLAAAETLSTARRITVVGDRESDIYEAFALRPEAVHLITRAGQNRSLESASPDTPQSLFEMADALPEQTRLEAIIPAAPGRSERIALLALRFCPVTLGKPARNGNAGLPDTVSLALVDIREIDPPQDVSPVHWRLLTSHRVETVGQARMILDFYRRRWIIEDYFRTLKTAGIDIEACDIAEPDAMTRFIGAAACAAVTVLQLVRARDGKTDQTIAQAFDPADQPLLETLSHKLEGKTQRSKNPHPRGSLAFAAWVIARLGSWDGYYGKPGPKVMRIGLTDFNMIKYGHHLDPKNV